MIESRQLRAFIAVAERLHFGRAADEIGMTQPGLSLLIKHLESDLGVRLLERRKRAAVKLTTAGELFLSEALAAVRQLVRTERVGRSAARGEVGQIQTGYVASAAVTGLLSSLLKTFKDAYPSVQMQLLPIETPKQLSGIADGTLDVGLLRPRRVYPEGVAAYIVHREPMLVAMAADHPLAQHAGLSPETLASESFIVPQFDESGGFANDLAALGAAAGFDLEPTYRVNDFIAALSMAAAGYGLVLTPKSARNFNGPGVVYRSVLGFDREAELAFAYRKNEPSACVRNFIAIAAARRLDLVRSDPPGGGEHDS